MNKVDILNKWSHELKNHKIHESQDESLLEYRLWLLTVYTIAGLIVHIGKFMT